MIIVLQRTSMSFQSEKHTHQIQKKLFEELKSKLANFNIEQKMDVVLEFSIDEIIDTSIFVNFDKKEITIEDKNQTISSSTYEISSSAGDIGRLLDEYLNWEDFMLSFSSWGWGAIHHG